ncbi:lipopolysaccharide heptosyltransferase II [Leptospirillum sp. Group II 'CF-1']|jgi:heptosyltransferase-2|uniref:lipopolysaccharide heptosyltransferase II n=1 Tax=Leptospirillum sp. Group II 'CF-1' TaxID=1660083 RepID=UPI0009E2A138
MGGKLSCFLKKYEERFVEPIQGVKRKSDDNRLILMRDILDKTSFRLMVLGVNWVGDAVLSLSTLQAVRNQFSQIKIFVLAPEQTKDVYALSPAVEHVLSKSFSREKKISSKNSLTLCFPLSFRSAWTLWKGGWPNRIGYGSEGRSFLLNRVVDYERWKSKKLHQSTYYKELAESVFGTLPDLDPALSVPTEKKDMARDFLRKHHMEDLFLVGINPGAYYGAAKMWPPEFYKDIVRRILEEMPEAGIVLFSGEKDRWVTREIASELPPDRVASTDGAVPLSESIALLSLCRYVVTNDSGMMHLGGALGLPGAALFGPTDPVATGPMGGRTRIFHFPVRCSPCFLRYCPIDHRCMRSLTPDLIWPTIREDLEKLKRIT